MTAGYRYPVLHTRTHTWYVPVRTDPPKSCAPRFVWLFFSGPCRSSAAYAWPLSLMSDDRESDDKSMPDEFRRPEPFSRGLSSHRTTIYCRSRAQATRCALPVNWHSVCTRRSRRASPRGRSGRTIARRRTNLARKVSSRAHFVWLRVRCARARAVLG